MNLKNYINNTNIIKMKLRFYKKKWIFTEKQQVSLLKILLQWLWLIDF